MAPPTKTAAWQLDIVTHMADIANHVALLPDLVSESAKMALELAVVKGDVARFNERLAPLEELVTRTAVIEARLVDGVSPVQCEERRVACETLRKGRSTVTVAQIQAAAGLKGRWLALLGSIVLGIGAAVGWAVDRILN